MTRYFTPEEANAELERVRPVAERMVAHRGRMLAAEARQEQIGTHVAGNGGGIDPSEPAAIDAELARESRAVAVCVDELAELGVQVKDVDTGLLDFPTLRPSGEEALLCWLLGEDDIRFWHTVDGGFAGRRPLPVD